MNKDNRMPPGIPYIVGNEFAERFCYYGINAILSIYMTTFLRYGDAKATTWQSLFKTAAYFSPLIGAVVSDVCWGKYRTILTFSVAYVAGCAILALGPPSGFTLALGLGFMALGTGGIKPCVATNVGDQFTSKNQHLKPKSAASTSITGVRRIYGPISSYAHPMPCLVKQGALTSVPCRSIGRSRDTSTPETHCG